MEKWTGTTYLVLCRTMQLVYSLRNLQKVRFSVV